MLAYWLIFTYFAAGSLLTHESRRSSRARTPVLLMFGAIMVCLAIGLRYQVGADWPTYKLLFSYARYADLGRVLRIGDPGYQFLNWWIQKVGLEIWGVNLVCSIIFTWGLYRFARAQPDPWLAFVVAIPYLVVVVAMGYTRQAVAIGILMAGLAAIGRGASVLRFTIYVAVAALFHKTAVVVLPIVILSGRRNMLLNLIAGAAAFYLMYDIFLAESVEGFVRDYIKAEYSSQGAAIRVAMIVLPATLFLLRPNGFGFSENEIRLWRNFSLTAFALLALLFISPSSTAVDRIALYILPLQIAVMSRLNIVYVSHTMGKIVIIGYAALVLFVWLNFAVYADGWIPYRVYPFG